MDAEETLSILECKQIFDIFDRDHSGFIDPTELGDGLRAMGSNPTEDEIEQLMQEGESKKNDDGKLNFEEFLNLMKKYKRPLEVEEKSLMEAFRCFDKNGDGKISKLELRETLTTIGMDKLNEDDVNDLFREADVDDDGFIEYKELVRTILKM